MPHLLAVHHVPIISSSYYVPLTDCSTDLDRWCSSHILQLRADYQAEVVKRLIPPVTQQVQTAEQNDEQQWQWQ